jgi:type IV pilus assembly protein PilA
MLPDGRALAQTALPAEDRPRIDMNHRNSSRRARGVVLSAFSGFLGVLAAIAIPAYQDYTLRSQVTEGLNIAGDIKAAVAEHFAETGKWPRDLRELQFQQAPRGKYVTFAALNHGTVVIRYSSAAGAGVARQQVTLRPTVSPEGEIAWSCGYAPDLGADPQTGAASPHATTVSPKSLPQRCRG